MNLMEAMEQRHAVRNYTEQPIEGDTLQELLDFVELCNAEGDLHIQLIQNEPRAFRSKYGQFSGVNNYIAMIGKKGSKLEEKCGYYGEKLVLKAQMLGLNTCWVAMSYKKIPDVFDIRSGEKLEVVIPVGYGQTQGKPHKVKQISQVSNAGQDTPVWFRQGVQAALLAPTAVNQQKFTFHYDDGRVRAKAGMGFYTKMDLGIAKYHFKIGAGDNWFEWA